jgi:hypothetical protein
MADDDRDSNTTSGCDSDHDSVSSADISAYFSASQPNASAAAMVAPILGPAPVLPALHLRRPDRKHQARFPYVLGGFDDDIVTIDWHKCNVQNICDIFTSKFFGSGKGAQKSMGVWAREVMKFLKGKCTADSTLRSRIEAVLACPRSALSSDDFEPLLQEILRQAVYLPPTRSFLEKYGKLHVLHSVSKSFWPQVTDVQVAECRSLIKTRNPPFFISYENLYVLQSGCSYAGASPAVPVS